MTFPQTLNTIELYWLHPVVKTSQHTEAVTEFAVAYGEG